MSLKNVTLANFVHTSIRNCIAGGLIAFTASISSSVLSATAEAAPSPVSATAESQIRRLVEPLLERYCHDQCKLLTVAVSVDQNIPDTVAPGFDELPNLARDPLLPTGAKLKLLLDDNLGPISRGKLVDLIQQYLGSLDYPVTINTQLAHFPSPTGAENKIADLRERVATKFQAAVNNLILQFCPEQCLFTDFNLKTEMVNAEEAQYGTPGEFVQEGLVTLKIKSLGGTILFDESLSADERKNIMEMINLKTNSFQKVNLTARSMNFPRPASLIGSGIGSGNELGANEGLKTGLRRGLASDTKNHSTNEIKNDLKNESKTDLRSDSKSASTNDVRENKNHQERLERFENTERVENGDAVTEELKRWRTYALIFACSILSLLIFIAVAGNRPRREIFNRLGMGSGRNPNPDTYSSEGSSSHSPATSEVGTQFAHRMESQHLSDELMQTFALHPRVAKHVFSRILSEDGIELTAKYLHIFGENVVIEILHDSSLQQEMNALLDYYGRTPIEIQAPEKLDLLRKLQQLTVAGKLAVIGNRSSNLFDFLSEMDAVQTYELVRKESLTVKAIVLTQCDAQKRSSVYNQLDENTQMLLLSELTRIDYLPRDYIANVANALKRKRRENPRLNTDALPGSEVLVTLLERSGPETTRGVIRNLEANSPDSARNVKAKLISLDTLCYLRDGQLLEVVLALKHDELLQFLKGAPTHIREDVFAKCPRELAIDLQDELVSLEPVSRETFATVERKIINRMKTMANAGMINLAETNDRMFGMSESRDASKQGDGGNMGMSTLQHRSFTNSKAAG